MCVEDKNIVQLYQQWLRDTADQYPDDRRHQFDAFKAGRASLAAKVEQEPVAHILKESPYPQITGRTDKDVLRMCAAFLEDMHTMPTDWTVSVSVWLMNEVQHALDAPARQDYETLLRRASSQLQKWHKIYGENDPKWLPPAGDVKLLEDIDAAPQAQQEAHDVLLTPDVKALRRWAEQVEYLASTFNDIRAQHCHLAAKLLIAVTAQVEQQESGNDAQDAARYRAWREKMKWQINPNRAATDQEVDAHVDRVINAAMQASPQVEAAGKVSADDARILKKYDLDAGDMVQRWLNEGDTSTAAPKQSKGERE